ncbi:sugar phosphate isomerase/epimerase [Novosphingobium sp. HII-3]|uniref:sugar phosphate isomerase/epimerase family protein n=1 Tax=Novosphingobium sp. HII-3 TaxID=2075565 RepID=UPI000CDB7231|nr:sugar phosphate isomerase/epimerase [Novosphingobium sp. HII-3]
MTAFYVYTAANHLGEVVISRETPFVLSLHQLTALDASPVRLVELAGDAGCRHVCIFTFVPEAAQGRYPLVTAGDAPELRRRMADAGVSLCNLEVFPLDGKEDHDAFARALDVGAALGATKATAHVHDVAGLAEAADRFGAFCDLAADRGIVAGLEFMGFSAIRDIAAAAQVVRSAGRGNLACDVLHLFRNGGGVADVAANADLIGYVQLCDGPMLRPPEEWWVEAVRMRQLPGDGELPLVDLVSALREDTVIEIEVPRFDDAKAGVSDAERVARAVEATRAVLRQAPVR